MGLIAPTIQLLYQSFLCDFHLGTAGERAVLMFAAGTESIATGFTAQTDTAHTHQLCTENLRCIEQIPERWTHGIHAQYDTGEKQEHSWKDNVG